MKGRRDIWEQLDLPGESIPGQVLVEITGDHRVLIEQHGGVCEYSSNQIGIKVKYGVVQICGSGLELRYMTKDHLIISGKIDCVILKRRECK